MSRNQPCYLVELPGELRCHILGYLFQDARITFSKQDDGFHPVKWLVVRHNTNVSILATCKNLRREASPMFWNNMEMFVPSDILYDLRNTGLWSHPSLYKMTSLQRQITNISIGVGQFKHPYADSVTTLAMVTCFVVDLKHYINLRRLTLVSVDDHELRSMYRNLQRQELYEGLSDVDRREMWDGVKSIQNKFFQPRILQRYTSRACWSEFWGPVYSLIMNWRSDPVKSSMIVDDASNCARSYGSQRNTSMTFKICHQNYEQVYYILKDRAVTLHTEPEIYEYGLLPPLIYEADIIELDDKQETVLQNIRLVGEHRAFWQQDGPPRRLPNIKGFPSLLMSYPFFVPEADFL